MDISIKNQLINIFRGNDMDSVNLAIGIIEANKDILTQDDLTIFYLAYSSTLHISGSISESTECYLKISKMCNILGIMYETGWDNKFSSYPFNYDSLKKVLNDPNLKIKYNG